MAVNLKKFGIESRVQHYFLVTLSALFFVLATPNANSQNAFKSLCELSFIGKESNIETKQYRTTYLLNRMKRGDSDYHEVLIVTRFKSDDGLSTYEFRRQVRKGAPYHFAPDGRYVEKGGVEPAVNSLDTLLTLVEGIVGKNIEQYENRREKWGDDFLTYLKSLAEDYLNDSIYIAVVDDSTGDIHGAERFILSPYGVKDGEIVAEGALVRRFYGPATEFKSSDKKVDGFGFNLPPEFLPEEKRLDIQIDKEFVVMKNDTFGVGMHMEMGALFVDYSLPPERRHKVWSELWLQVVRMAHMFLDDEINFFGSSIHAYADAASKKLYLPLGFELLRTYTHKGKKVNYEGMDEDDIPPIVREDGSQWWPIVYRIEKINEFVKEWQAGERKNRSGKGIKERLRSLSDLKDFESVSVTLLDVERYFKLLSTNGWLGRRRGDIESISRLIELHGLMNRYLKSDDTARAERAAFVLEQIRPLRKEIEKNISLLNENPEEIERMGNTVFAYAMMQESRNGEPFLPYRVIIEELFMPAFFDESILVSESAIGDFQNSFRSTKHLRDVLGLDFSEKSMHVEQSLSNLQAAGFSLDEINSLARDFAETLNRPIFDPSKEDDYQRKVKQLDRQRIAFFVLWLKYKDKLSSKECYLSLLNLVALTETEKK